MAKTSQQPAAQQPVAPRASEKEKDDDKRSSSDESSSSNARVALPTSSRRRNNIDPSRLSSTVTVLDKPIAVAHPASAHASWSDWRAYLAAYMEATSQQIRVQEVISIAARNKRLATTKAARAGASLPLVPATWEAYQRTYICTHGWGPKARGTGQRYRQKRYTACPFRFVVQMAPVGVHASSSSSGTSTSSRWRLVVKHGTFLHNHAIGGVASTAEPVATRERPHPHGINDPANATCVDTMVRAGVSNARIFRFLVDANERLARSDVDAIVDAIREQQRDDDTTTTHISKDNRAAAKSVSAPATAASTPTPKRVFFSRYIPYAIDAFRKLTAASTVPIEIAYPHAANESALISRDELLAQVAGCSGLFCLLTDRIDTELLAAAGPSLAVVSTMSVGYNHIDVAACRANNVQVGYTPGVLDTSTAETAVALTFAAKRQLLASADSARRGDWGHWQPFQFCGSSDISGSTVGVVGLGRIGAAFARMMHGGFGCNVLYTGPRRKPAVEQTIVSRDGSCGIAFVDMDTLLAQSDVVSLHVPLTPSTHHLMDATSFCKMKSDAVLINTSRGDVVDQDALVQALQSRTIAAAGLDVTTPEPLPPNHALFGLDNCIVLPHIGSATVTTRRAMADMAVQNLVAGVCGKELPHGVC